MVLYCNFVLNQFLEKSIVNILPNFSFCVPQKKQSHEGEYIFNLC